MSYVYQGVLVVCLTAFLIGMHIPEVQASCRDQHDGCAPGSCCGGVSPGGKCWGACFGGCPGFSGCATDEANKNLINGIGTGVKVAASLARFFGKRKLLVDGEAQGEGGQEVRWRHDTTVEDDEDFDNESLSAEDFVQVATDPWWNPTNDMRDGDRLDEPKSIFNRKKCSIPGPTCKKVWPELEKRFKGGTFVLAHSGLCTYTGIGGTYKSLPLKVKGCPVPIDVWVLKKGATGSMQCMSGPDDDSIATPAPSWCYTCDAHHKCRDQPGGLVISIKDK